MSEHTRRICAAVYCFGMMVLLGVSDALRGVFLPVMRETFSLTQAQGSAVIMVSYIGNLLFLTVGGALIGKWRRKHFLCFMMLLWAAALTAYALTRNVFVIYGGMLLSMGASTMLSTTVNVTTPLLFASPALLVNVFNFAQGIGISSAQNLGGRVSDRFSAWQCANLLLLCGGAAMLLLLILCIRIPEEESGSAPVHPLKTVFSHPAAKYLLLLFGCYCVAEHGLQNWLVTYGSEYLGYTREQSARFLSYFFIGITVGRLIFAPLVQRLGIMKSLLWFMTAAGILYIGGLLLGRGGIALVCGSGLAFSILFPTMILLTGSYYPQAYKGAATSWITGLANLFDIAFNAGFGSLVQTAGFGRAILVLPGSMLLCCICLYLLRFRVKQPNASHQ